MAGSDRITAEIARQNLHYDPLTGEFTRIVTASNAPGAKAGDRAGSLNKRSGYIEVRVMNVGCYGHRLAWLYVHGEWPCGRIDHINGDRSDNRIANLRVVSAAVNQQNRRRAQSNNKTGMLGVHKYKNTGRFISRIKTGKRQISLGVFDTAEEAHAVYLNAKRQLHEGCTL